MIVPLSFRTMSLGVRIALLLWLVLTLCFAEEGEPLLLLLPIVVGSLAAFLYPLLYALAGEKLARARRIVLLLGLSVGGSGLALLPILRLQQAITRHRGEATIMALERYYQQHQQYPDSFEQLVPAYLGQVPRTGRGVFSSAPFRYHVAADSTARQTYWLGYYGGALVDATYNSRTRQWIAED